MGSFNLSGFYSHLPIQYGDRIGAIICAQQYRKSDNIIVEKASETGLFPIMTPIYGTYNDYGGIKNIVESYSIELFKQLTGHTIEEFIEANYRNSNVDIYTEDNGNQFDNIPFYQSIIKHFVPTEDEVEKVDISPNETNEDVIKQLNDINAYYKKENEEARKSTFIIIYEHEAVLKQMIKVGEKWFGYMIDKQTTAKSYDNAINTISKIELASGYPIKNMLQHKCSSLSLYLMQEVANISNEEERKQYLNEILNNDALTQFDRYLMDIKIRKMFMRLYKNVNSLDMIKIKDDFLNLLFLDRGLYWMHGAYVPCVYAGQEIYVDEIREMQNIYNGIVNKFVDK